MSVRKVIATVGLAAGLTGAGLIIADTSLVLGSTSDAGVVTICFNKTACSPGGPVQATIPPTPITIAPGSTAATP